jgi:hypothetical protein
VWDSWSIKRVAIPTMLFYWGGELTRTLLLAPRALRDPHRARRAVARASTPHLRDRADEARSRTS